MPIVRALELTEQGAPRWCRTREHLLGDDILVAPVTRPFRGPEPADEPARFERPLRRRVWFHDADLDQSKPLGTVPDRDADEIALEREIRFDALDSSELHKRWGDGFMSVWEGVFIAQADAWYRFELRGNGLKSLTVDQDEYPQILPLCDAGVQEATLRLASGPHEIRCTYLHTQGAIAEIVLTVEQLPALSEDASATVPVWVPSGHWRDAWSGAVLRRPGRIMVRATTSRSETVVASISESVSDVELTLADTGRSTR